MRLPIASSIESRDGTLSKDAKLVNCFVSVENEQSFVVKRPGLLKTVAAAAGAGLGMVSWEGNMYHGIGATIYQTSYASIPSGSGGGGGSVLLKGSISGVYSDYVTRLGSYLYFINKDDGFLYRSTNGVSWSVVNSNTVGFSGLCPVSGGVLISNGIYLFGYDKYNGVARRSSDGVTWTNIGAQNVVQNVNAGQSFMLWDGSRFVHISYLAKIYTSTDFVTWSIANNSYSTPVNTGAVYVGGRFFLNDSYSNDLTTFTTLPNSPWGGVLSVYVTDGTNLYVLSFETYTTGITVYSVNPSTLSVSTVFSNSGFGYDNSGYGYSANNPCFLASKIYFVTSGASSSSTYEITLAGDPWTTPAQSYSVTTATPGLPLSWVGTSPGTYTKKMFIKNTERAWTLTLGTPGTLTQVTDADYPAVTVPGAVYLDGYFFVMDKDGTIYNCDLENPDSWNSLNYITAEAEWDKGVAIAKHQNYVLALKDWTCELFYDAANPTGSPLAKVANAAIQLGCAQGYSVTQFHGGLVFMSKTREKGRSVHVFPVNGIDPQEIATPAVQRILNASDLTSVSAWGGKIAGRVLYVLNLVTANITLVYDFSTQTWAQWTSDTAGAEGHFLCGFYATDGNRDYLLHESTGEVFSLTMDAYQDNGANIKVLARTGRIDAGNLDRKTMRALSVVGDQAATSVSVQSSDDDYQTFSAARTVSLASLPARLTRLGMFRRRSFDIRHVDNTPLRLLALDAEIEQAR